MNVKPSTALSEEGVTIKYVCGVDVGSQSCAGCICRPDKCVVVKPITFANTREGWQVWEEKLNQLDALPSQILIGMEPTSCYHENLYQELERRGYVLHLLYPRQAHQFHERQGLRAKTDRLDAMTIAKVLLSGEARVGYVPSEQAVTYRELVRLHMHLRDEAAASTKRDPGSGGRALPRILFSLAAWFLLRGSQKVLTNLMASLPHFACF